MKKGSIGLIETRGFIPAVAAADAGSKAANVALTGCQLTWPALVTVTFKGDVAAVRAATASGVAAAQAVGEVVSVHVIARPNADIEDPGPADEDPFAGEPEGGGGKKALVEPALQEDRKAPALKKKAGKKVRPATKRKTTPAKSSPKTTTTGRARTQKLKQASPVKEEAAEEKKGVARDTATSDQKVAQEQKTAAGEQQPDREEKQLSGPTAETSAPKTTQQAKRKRAVNRRRTARQKQRTQSSAPPVDKTAKPVEAKPEVTQGPPQPEEKKESTPAVKPAADSEQQQET